MIKKSERKNERTKTKAIKKERKTSKRKNEREGSKNKIVWLNEDRQSKRMG